MDFQSLEDRDGTRFSWNLLPRTRIDSTRIVLPLGCVYTPLKQTDNLHLLNYEPLVCRSTNQACGAFLHPFCRVDFRAKTWECSFCLFKNNFPAFYAQQILQRCSVAKSVPQKSTSYENSIAFATLPT